MAEDPKKPETDKPAAAAKTVAEDVQSGLPKLLSGEGENPNVHILPPAAKKHAGKYRVTHGSVRLGPDTFYGPGTVLHMSADDGHRFASAGVAERIDE